MKNRRLPLLTGLIIWAALAGNAEAQRKFGLLLGKGGPGLPADPVKSRTWLQQAAAQNDPDAKKALDALPK